MRTTILLLLGTLLLFPSCRGTREYPSQPIRLICPWAVGGGTDRMSRQIAFFLEKDLGVPVNVVNITGGAGVTGHHHGAEARPDGYTLSMITVEINMFRWRDLTELSWDNYIPVALINQDPAALFVRADDNRWSNLKDLNDRIREQPGVLTASGTAAGGIWHLAVAGWLISAGSKPADLKWIPMTGASPSLQELVSGGLDVVSCSLPEASTLMQAGKVRALGVMAPERMPGFEEIPTFKEQGIDWELGAWRGLALPPGVAPEIVDTLAASIRRVVMGETSVNGQRFPATMRQQGFTVTWQGPEEFRNLLAETDAELRDLLRSEEFLALRRNGSFQPTMFPYLLMVGLGLSLLFLLGLSAYGSVGRPDTGVGDRPSITRQGWIYFAAAIAAVVIFVLVVEKAGFVLTSGTLALLLLLLLGSRWWVSVLITALLVPSVYHLFANWLRVPLPRGWLGW